MPAGTFLVIGWAEVANNDGDTQHAVCTHPAGPSVTESPSQVCVATSSRSWDRDARGSGTITSIAAVSRFSSKEKDVRDQGECGHQRLNPSAGVDVRASAPSTKTDSRSIGIETEPALYSVGSVLIFAEPTAFRIGDRDAKQSFKRVRVVEMDHFSTTLTLLKRRPIALAMSGP
jgi:hypothetical protein